MHYNNLRNLRSVFWKIIESFFILSVNKIKEKFSRGQGYKSTTPGIACTLVTSCYSKSLCWYRYKNRTAQSEPEFHWLDCADFLIYRMTANHQPPLTTSSIPTSVRCSSFLASAIRLSSNPDSENR